MIIHLVELDETTGFLFSVSEVTITGFLMTDNNFSFYDRRWESIAQKCC